MIWPFSKRLSHPWESLYSYFACNCIDIRFVKQSYLYLWNNRTTTGIIYKTQRAEVILQFRERPWLPNPLSLLWFIFTIIKKLLDKCVCKKKLYRSQIKKVNRQNASFNAFRASLIEAECVAIYTRKKKLKAVSVTSMLDKITTLVASYLFSLYWQVMAS